MKAMNVDAIVKTANSIEKDAGWEAALMWLLTVPGGHTMDEARRRVAWMKKMKGGRDAL